MDVEVDLLAEPFVAHVAGEGALLVVHQTLVLVEHGLEMEREFHIQYSSSFKLIITVEISIETLGILN